MRDPVSVDLAVIARAIRARVLALTPTDAPSHLTSALSLVEILAAVYGSFVDLAGIRGNTDDRDRVLLSKGHGALAWYAALAECGLVTDAEITDYGPGSTKAPVHPIRDHLHGIEATSGSLGHGLAVGAGFALASALRDSPARTVVILGDGELQEGSIWEAALFAGNHQLKALHAIVDMNGLQQTGRLENISDLTPLAEKWRSFGWQVEHVDGHDAHAIATTLHSRLQPVRPLVVLAKTVKGRGVPHLENRDGWHYRVPGRQFASAQRNR